MRKDTHFKKGKTETSILYGNKRKYVKALCGWIGKKGNLNVTKSEEKVNCEECLDILVDDL